MLRCPGRLLDQHVNLKESVQIPLGVFCPSKLHNFLKKAFQVGNRLPVPVINDRLQNKVAYRPCFNFGQRIIKMRLQVLADYQIKLLFGSRSNLFLLLEGLIIADRM